MEVFEDGSMAGSSEFRDEKKQARLIWRTDLPFVCVRGGTLLVVIKGRGGVVFALVVVVGVGCVNCRLSSVVVVVRFGISPVV